MTISNYNNQYFKLQSTAINDLIANPTDYSKVKIQGYINCCDTCEDFIEEIIPISSNKWLVDMSAAVASGTYITAINFQSIFNGEIYNPIVAPGIDLSYIADHCMSSPCTLQTFSSHFAPLIKTAIDTFFSDAGVTSNVTVQFTGNVMTLSNIPTNFVPINTEWTDSIVTNKQIFYYNSLDNNTIIILADGIYISPLLFNQSTLTDGVYKFVLTLSNTDDVVTEETNCAFIDVLYKCKVASLLNGIIAESKTTTSTEQPCTIAHLLHYALTNGSNCGCNCDDLCSLFRTLYDILYNVNPQANNCGC